MLWTFFIVLFAMVMKSGSGLDCTRYPFTTVSAGTIVHLPGSSNQLKIIPANFNCLYKISVPGNFTYGLSASVLIQNGMRGVNDFIRVVDMMGEEYVLNNKTFPLNQTYVVIPGAEMTIQVVTRSVYMQSMFEITVEYLSAQIGPTIPMKTGAEMNYIDVSSLRDGESLFNSVTFLGTEPIHMTYAFPESPTSYCWDCVFVIDGTIANQTQVHRFSDNSYQPFTTKSNAITIATSSDNFLGFVFNPKSEADKFVSLDSLAVTNSIEENRDVLRTLHPGDSAACQVVNFHSTGIIMERFDFDIENCTAYVVSGPPNNSSKVLLDLSTYPEMPHSFDVNYFSVVAVDCSPVVYVNGYGN